MLDSDKKYLTIGEVSERTHVPEHTLRYWEKEKLLKPIRHSGLRKYLDTDIELILTIKDLLHEKKFTVEGAKKYLKGDKRKKVKDVSFETKNIDEQELTYIKNELKSILEMLKE
ncbi:MerR family transcriptional regulator [Candidatus Ruminimicrobium bovinum]|uniref:MerR family transcriptional regulator n=1 Tax=Candidatus Ruminimicrobium bovinum TaxID=3242779 RepID=UPI0039B9CAB8